MPIMIPKMIFLQAERFLGAGNAGARRNGSTINFALPGKQTCRRSILLGLYRRVRHENGSVEILECLPAILLAQRQSGGAVLKKPAAGRTHRDLWRLKTDARFLYVADFVEAILLADRIEPAGEMFQIASWKRNVDSKPSGRDECNAAHSQV